jgi:hypothetical protein
MQHKGRYGAVDAAAHGYQYFSVPAHKRQRYCVARGEPRQAGRIEILFTLLFRYIAQGFRCMGF